MIITIDGPSGTGKSTIAKKLAHLLRFTFFDTGAMYRSFAWFVQNRGKAGDPDQICLLVSEFHFSIETNAEGGKQYLVNGLDVTHQIRFESISALASEVAKIPEVRHELVSIQRRLAAESNAVFEGRDMGTVVFPEADLKIFLTANPEVRAQRRYQELVAKFPDCLDSLSLEQIQQDIIQRDHNDATRQVSPLKQAPDAILIDTSYLSIQQVTDKIIDIYKKKLQRLFPKMKWPYWLVCSFARLFFRFFFRLQVRGLEYFRPGAGIIAANHVSLYDPEVVSISCPEEVHFLAKESLFRIPILGRLIRILNAHPVSRGGADAATFRLTLRLLQEGKKVILFPEGKRSPDGSVQPLEKGLAFLVQKGKCPIFPVYVSGTFDAWPRGRKFPKLRGKIVCTFGPPIEWKEFEKMDKKEASANINERTYEALCSLQREQENLHQ
ncbi:MAG: (d)CMP kinase [Chlamydiales bacterium]|nr:(d)CMP kinase [Chlamydiales bacterium]